MIIRNPSGFPSSLQGGVLCIGNFDGVHRGHAAMLNAGRKLATEKGKSFSIMTFDPHPALLLRPDTPRPPLTTQEQREALLEGFGADVLVVIPTSMEFLAISAEDFAEKILRDAFGAALIVEGATFTFGKGAKGNVETLRAMGATLGFEVEVVPSQQAALSDLTQVNVSSSLIRWLLENGRVDDAAKCLGRPHTLRGPVVHGKKRGRTIGYPTANIFTPQLLPAGGVYAGLVRSSFGVHRAAISIGTNPTFGTQPLTVEAYLLDFEGDLYDQTIDIEFHRWVREMRTFSGVEGLIKQMARDVQITRETIALP